MYVRSEGSGDTDLMRRLVTEHWLLVDAISSEILCAGPFVSEWLSLFHLPVLQDEI